MKRLMLTVTLVAISAGSAVAQTNFSTNQLNSIKNQNSSAQYSSQRYRNSVFNSAVPQYNFSSVNRNLFSGAMKPPSRSKPFSHVQQGANTNPYMGLLSDNPFTSSTTNYFNNVRPQIEQQRMNQKLMEQNMKMQKQLNSIAARPPFDPTGSEDRAPTGHAAVYQEHGGVFGNPGGFYPQVPIRGVRGRK